MKRDRLIERNEKIIELRDIECLTWRAIGERFHLTAVGAYKIWLRAKCKRQAPQNEPA